MKPVIEVQGLSKVYNISHRQEPEYVTLRETVMGLARKPLELITGQPEEREKFWALKDVGFTVNPGEVVGIIGHNGSGKSTLLKTLSRIVEPTEGKITMRGKVASLLEVGTGFHPELTGRENIYFNGAILGMSKKEIDRKFKDIVEFSEVEQFLDTPVKFYSSGMYVRLAFAVAAHLEPDILIVDEVLAVGDASFQKKSLGKMKDVAGQGRTVLFVSHNMMAIEQMCNSIIYLDHGRMVQRGTEVKTITKDYLFGTVDSSAITSEWRGEIQGKEYITINRLAVVDKDGNTVAGPITDEDNTWIQIEGVINNLDPLLSLGYAIYAEDGSQLFWSFHTDMQQEKWPKLSEGPFVIRSPLPKQLLNEGVYRIELVGSLFAHGWIFEPTASPTAVYFSTVSTPSGSPYWISTRPTLLAPHLGWERL